MYKMVCVKWTFFLFVVIAAIFCCGTGEELDKQHKTEKSILQKADIGEAEGNF